MHTLLVRVTIHYYWHLFDPESSTMNHDKDICIWIICWVVIITVKVEKPLSYYLKARGRICYLLFNANRND